MEEMSTSTFSSITGAPSYMTKQYTPLASTFREHSEKFPDNHLPEPNSEDLQMKFSNEFCKDVDDMETELCEGLTNKQQGKAKRQRRKITQKEDISAHHIPRSLQKARKHTKSTRRKSEQVLYCKCGAESGLEQCHHCRPIPGVHYRMNLRDVPFLLTASTSPSHSITANYQQLLASMKCHNGLLCGAAAAAQKKKTNCFKSVTAMKALLKSLEEEFGRLTFEHQELAQKLTTRQPAAFGLSEEQLQHLADQMELKTKQIGIVSRQLGATANSRIDRPSTSVQVTCSRDANVKFLRRIKDIKTTLQENDLSWD
ncbi:Centrosomal protein of 57 kDa [Geodia barretti]|uniref:Centrosomal protein of 57 kDa n=1 Tax=Geodia barretti TaxID=519541 RepID=A0AA35WXP1_GEOBA|nr:Centrosomal protein of 57 kDa [Geodia barretti]